MSGSSIEDLAFAKQFKEWIAEEVAAQIQQIAPRRRIAEVTAIDMDARRAKVVYVGETSEVSLPFNSAVPSYVGQNVVVDGPPQDRSIVDVLGQTATERELGEVEAPEPDLWIAPVDGMHESYPSRLRTNADHNEAINSGNIVLAPMRARRTLRFYAVGVNVQTPGTSSNSLTLGIYKYEQDESWTLLGKSDPIPMAVGGMMIINTDIRPTIERGSIFAVGAHISGTSTYTRLSALDHVEMPSFPSSGATMRRMSDVSAIPPAIQKSQTTAVNNKTLWAIAMGDEP